MSEQVDIRARLDEIKARADAATEGPWERDGGDVGQHWTTPGPHSEVVTTEVSCGSYCYGGSSKGIVRDEDAEFIAHARTDNPAMAAALTAVLDLADRLEWEGQPENHSGDDLDYGRIATAERIRAAITEKMGGDRG